MHALGVTKHQFHANDANVGSAFNSFAEVARTFSQSQAEQDQSDATDNGGFGFRSLTDSETGF